MKEIKIGVNDAEQRIDKFLFKLFKDVPGSMIYKWLRKKRIKVNGKKAENSYKLQMGDLLELYINDEFFNEDLNTDNVEESNTKTTTTVDKSKITTTLNKKGVKIVYEDENLILINKKSGINSHGGENSALGAVTQYLIETGAYNQNESHTFAPSLCNRIDRNTEGIVIIAKNAASLREMNERIKNREIRKLYLLKAEGIITSKEGVIEGYLLNDEVRNVTRFYEKQVKGSKYSRTNYKVLQIENNCSIVEAELVTGRKHQIRVHFSQIGHPLVGDVKYGAKKNGERSYQSLCAYKIEFIFRTEGALSYMNGKVFSI